MHCFNAWLAARGGIGNGEVTAVLRQVRRFLEANGEGRFVDWNRAGDSHNQKTLNRAGFRRVFCADGEPFKDSTSTNASDSAASLTYVLDQGGATHYFVFPEVFRAEMCQGFDYKFCARVLVEHGCLIPSKGRSFDSKHRLPGMGKAPVICYHLPPKIFELDL